MNFEPDPDDGTLPPGVHSREAGARAQEITGTQPTDKELAKQDGLRKGLLLENKARSKWGNSEIRRMATQEQWDYGLRHGHLEVGTISAVGNLLLKGLSRTATRKILGITPNTWNTWMLLGTGDDVGTQRPVASDADDDASSPLPQSPYSVFVFVVEHSEGLMEMKAVNGWAGHIDRDWRAAQAFLVARNPDEWNPSNKSTIDITSKQDVTVTRQLDTEGLLEVAAILQRANALPSTTASAEVMDVETLEISDRSISTDDQ